MIYSIKNPMCEHIISTQAANDQQAVNDLTRIAIKHMYQVHPEVKLPSQQEIADMVETTIRSEQLVETGKK